MVADAIISNIAPEATTQAGNIFADAMRGDVTKVANSDVVDVTKANLAQSNSGGFEFTANGRIGAMLSYSLSGNLFYNEIDSTALGVVGRRSTTG